MRPPIAAHVVAHLFLLLQVGGPAASGQDWVASWTDREIVIDGDGGDEAWAKATVIDDFKIPETLTAPRTQTRLRLLWDRSALYFLAELDDHDLFADIVDHDGMTWNNDVFEIFLKPDEQASGYYELQVNAAGTRMDMFVPQRQPGAFEAFKAANPFAWQTAVKRRGTLNPRTDRDSGWVVEGKIPWADFMPSGGRPDSGEIWRAAFCRYDYTLGQEPELSSSARLSKPNFHAYEDYGRLRFAGPAEGDAALKKLAAQTHVTARLYGTPDPPLPYRAVRAYPDLHLNFPIDLRVQPGTRQMVIIEEDGKYGPTKIVRTREPDSPQTLDEIIDPKGVAYSLAFHPRFEENGWLYVGSNGKVGDQPNHSRIQRYEISRESPYPVIGEPVTIIEWESNGHNGAAITFGLDGMLYVTTGDGTSDSDQNDVGQDLTTLLAKVLRIDVDHAAPGTTYAVPQDNPFVTLPGARGETWAYGLRNPWRMTTDPHTGQIWVGNNGQDLWEQVYLLQRGANYGWSVYEGSHPFYPHRKLGPTPLVLPTVEHHHSESRSLTGGVVYHGKNLPELRGAYVYADHSTGKVWAVKHDGDRVLWNKEIADTPFFITAIALDPDGELLLLDHAGDKKGGLYRLELNQDDGTASAKAFPRRLSETGLFEDTQGHQVAAGLIPYNVIAPLWSDNAAKERWIALPKDGSMQLTDRWGWEFPNETVLMKSFSLDTAGGNPGTQTWVETRLMLKRDNEWIGYSYAWNEEQTDAFLVDAGGEDREFTTESGTQPDRLKWHYPSRTECMVCHTRAANFVLGISTLQLNSDHDYGDGVSRNQLETLEALGVLRTSWESDGKLALRRDLESLGKSKTEIDTHVAAVQVADGQKGLRSRGLLAKPPREYPSLVNPYDPHAELALRARSYLHSNCAYCHTEAGGGNARIDLAFEVPLEKMRILEESPLHHSFGFRDAKVIASGEPDRSVLQHRVGIRGPGQMPQLGTERVDQAAWQMLREWIATLQPALPVGPREP